MNKKELVKLIEEKADAEWLEQLGMGIDHNYRKAYSQGIKSAIEAVKDYL